MIKNIGCREPFSAVMYAMCARRRKLRSVVHSRWNHHSLWHFDPFQSICIQRLRTGILEQFLSSSRNRPSSPFNLKEMRKFVRPSHTHAIFLLRLVSYHYTNDENPPGAPETESGYATRASPYAIPVPRARRLHSTARGLGNARTYKTYYL
jgi:hypothetical protein